MYIIIVFAVLFLLLTAFSFTGPGRRCLDWLRFFTEGKDKGFLFSNLVLLWRTANYVGLEDKSRLFWSVGALDECIRFISRQVENKLDSDISQKMQILLNKLYDYRTKVELEEVQKKRRLESTYEIYIGQICIIFVPRETTVYGKLMANTKTALVFALFDASAERAEKVNWQNKDVKVYFWKQNDAGYVFYSQSVKSKKIDDRLEIYVKHSKKMVRTQKRKSVRASCNLEGLMFPLRVGDPYNSHYETQGGVKSNVKDISEDGAMFFVRGKAAKGIRMKLQFKLKNTEIVMCGKIVRFIYDQPSNKSRVHFQCEFLDQKMKNVILSYIYNIAADDNTEFMQIPENMSFSENDIQEQEDSVFYDFEEGKDSV
ncbi:MULTISPECIES: PilZ domain-containing protein [unclassified Treponema]|uniref:PilZ domain-containing protein n=1 Tax=unclassified Treponema TaxID=2638727 RepID=UPI0020A36B6E|nr:MULTISPECIES: PilZ domain-containing protein [unclassified Treponema]UTC67778.1 PilZ domain-containing protein [Treponema sp. OMZ 789]UTC70503.1 PilZ domain-containing protein [Treponema sp. OMZ 790]UTC73215.1 PilZ domain-containing protein [Treponema sp. OMZ 791]